MLLVNLEYCSFSDEKSVEQCVHPSEGGGILKSMILNAYNIDPVILDVLINSRMLLIWIH